MSATAYGPETTDLICDRIAGGETLRTICADPAMPAKSTVMVWLRDNQDFAQGYSRACEQRAIAWGEEIIEIADHAEADDAIAVQRARLKIDARKWLMGKANPKKYGDKIDLNHSGSIGSKAPDVSVLEPKERDVLLLLLEKVQGAAEAEDRG